MDTGKIPRLMETNHKGTNPQAKKRQLRSTKLQTYLLNQLLMQNSGKNNKQQVDLVFRIEQPYIQLTIRIPQEEKHYQPSNVP